MSFPYFQVPENYEVKDFEKFYYQLPEEWQRAAITSYKVKNVHVVTEGAGEPMAVLVTDASGMPGTEDCLLFFSSGSPRLLYVTDDKDPKVSFSTPQYPWVENGKCTNYVRDPWKLEADRLVLDVVESDMYFLLYPERIIKASGKYYVIERMQRGAFMNAKWWAHSRPNWGFYTINLSLKEISEEEMQRREEDNEGYYNHIVIEAEYSHLLSHDRMFTNAGLNYLNNDHTDSILF